MSSPVPIEKKAPGRWRRGWLRWEALRDTSNLELLVAAGLAFTRGFVYSIPTHERIPKGLDLLPRGALSVYGVIWLGAAFYGFLHCRDHQEQKYARRFLAGIAMAWATIYAVANFSPDADHISLWASSVFYILIAGVAWASKPRVVYKYTTLFIVHGKDDAAGFVMLEPDTEGGGNGA